MTPGDIAAGIVSFIGETLTLAFLAAVVCAVSYAVGMFSLFISRLLTSKEPVFERGLYIDPPGSNSEIPTSRWWKAWGKPLTLALVLLGLIIFWFASFYGDIQPLLNEPSINGSNRGWLTFLWYSLALLAVLALLGVVAISIRAGWKGSLGVGVPVVDFFIFGAIVSLGDVPFPTGAIPSILQPQLNGLLVDNRIGLSVFLGWCVIAVPLIGGSVYCPSKQSFLLRNADI